MNPESELLLRSRGRLTNPAETLWINPPADGFWQPFEASQALTFHHGEAALLADHLTVSTEPVPRPARHVVLYLPKSKARLTLMVELAAAGLAAGGKLWLVGAKKAGAPSAGKQLNARFGSVQKLDAARHCMLFEASDALAGPGFDIDRHWQSFDGPDLKLASLPGVFSHGRLDDASAMLIESLPSQMPGTCLDFGCGCGVLSAVAARRGATVTAIDSDELAVRSTRRTLAENGLQGSVLGATQLPRPDEPLQWVISNPPFHQGLNTDLNATHQMLNDAAASLSRDGELWLVANRFLDYPKRLAALFDVVDEPAGDRSFRVLRARRPKSRPR
ncbi:MAG: methyltransferase [Pseudomonadota bacterium]